MDVWGIRGLAEWLILKSQTAGATSGAKSKILILTNYLPNDADKLKTDLCLIQTQIY